MPISASRVVHVNLNCSDLAASLRYWRIGVGLEPQIHTTAEPQDCAALGLGRCQWDAWLLADGRGWDGVSLDLLEWREPRPTARALHAGEAGLGRLVFESTDLDALVERTQARIVGELDDDRRFAFGTDPDGVAVSFVDGAHDRLATVTCNVTDLDVAITFYESLGFTLRRAPVTHGDPAAPTTVAMLDDPRGDDSFGIELIAREGIVRGPTRVATDLGLFRVALLTDRLDGDVEVLVRETDAEILGPPGRLDLGEGVPPVRAACVRGPAGECIELVENPGPEAPG